MTADAKPLRPRWTFLWPAGLLIFLVSVTAFSEVGAQSLSLSDQRSLLELYRQKPVPTQTTPEVYAAPRFDPTAEAADVQPHAAEAPATETPTTRALVYDDSLPKPGGELARFGSDFFRTGAETYRPPVGPVSPQYRLGPGDRLYLTTWGRVDLEYELAVDPSGQVYVPKVGAIRAFALTLSEFEQKLKQSLERIYSDFDLSVTVSQIRSVGVHVYGEVARPGTYTLNALSTLLDILTVAGGPNERGSFRAIKLIRRTGENSQIDLYRFFADGDLKADQPVADGDIMFVPVSGPQVKIRGEVRRPGIYELRGDAKLRDLIELAGGARPDAYLGRVLVDRIDPTDHRTVLDCNLDDANLADANNIALQDGDDISIYPAYGERNNVVWIDGAVKHPGGYERLPQMTVHQLVRQAGGLVAEAHTARADLERHPADGVRSLIQVSLDQMLADSTAGPELLPRDRLIVYDRMHLERPRKIRIEGAVKIPGEYDLFDQMRLSDLIFRAGNPNRSAYLYRAEIARLLPDGGTTLLYSDLGRLLADSRGPDDPVLEEDDFVFVREIPRWRNQELVTIEGQVLFPGSYALAHDAETFWDLVQRAGGPTECAFLRGTVFIRQAITEDIERSDYARVVESSTELREDSQGVIQPAYVAPLNPQRLTRLVLDMERLYSTEGREGNVMLRDGDKIYIPRMPSGVQVMGAVAAPGTILYEEKHRPSYYVQRAGDFTRQSDKSNVRLIKADGRVFSGREATGRRVEIGDAIYVPQQVKKERDWWKIVTGSVSVVTGLATTALLVDRL